MEPPTDFRRLSDDEWAQFQERADRFAEAAARAPVIDWTAHLDGLTGNLRKAILHEFIKIDLESRWKRGDRAFVDDYLRRFPELGGPYELPTHLVHEEFRIRRSFGDKPDPESYYTRFPHLAETLRGLFDDKSNTYLPLQTLNQSIGTGGKSTAGPPPKKETVLPAVGEYQLMKLLGQGQFGSVWKAMAPGGVEVAVKVITQPADRESAQRELKALELVKNLRHPCLMGTLAFWEHDNKLNIVCELADETLRDRLKAHKKEGRDGVPGPELVRYFEQVAEGLDYLHSMQVFHRDIKPDNILLVKGHAKLADFGLARTMDRPDISVSFAGTPIYMAPEVWGGKFQARSDMYSLAITYAELRLGRPPHDGKDLVELMTQQLESAPNLQGLPAAEQAVLNRALAKQPIKRHATAMEFAAELRKAVIPDDRPAVSGKGHKLGITLGGLALIIALSFAGYAAFGPGGKVETGEGDKKPSDPPITNPPITDPPITNPPVTDPPIKDPPKVFVPAGYQMVAGSATIPIDNRLVAKKIEKLVPGAGPQVFVLVVTHKPTLKSFYMLEGKASNALMAAFAAEQPDGRRIPAAVWKLKPSDLPAVDLTVAEAAACAAWLGGKLPTPAQWDEAASLHEPPPNELGIAQSGKAHFGTKDLRAVNAKDRDFSPKGIADMAGNGREWTAMLIAVKTGALTPLPEKLDDPKALIILRGRMQTLATPLSYADLQREQKEPQTQYAGTPSKYTGFRVVVPVFPTGQ